MGRSWKAASQVQKTTNVVENASRTAGVIGGILPGLVLAAAQVVGVLGPMMLADKNTREYVKRGMGYDNGETEDSTGFGNQMNDGQGMYFGPNHSGRYVPPDMSHQQDNAGFQGYNGGTGDDKQPVSLQGGEQDQGGEEAYPGYNGGTGDDNLMGNSQDKYVPNSMAEYNVSTTLEKKWVHNVLERLKAHEAMEPHLATAWTQVNALRKDGPDAFSKLRLGTQKALINALSRQRSSNKALFGSTDHEYFTERMGRMERVLNPGFDDSATRCLKTKLERTMLRAGISGEGEV